MIRNDKKISGIILATYIVCYTFRLFEDFILRTDQTFWNEAFIHKLAGILVLYLVLRYLRMTWQDIGFKPNHIAKNLRNGLLLGILIYCLAYAVEIAILSLQGKFESLELYVTSYAVDENVGRETGLLFFVICFLGNVINVIMEEGIFRGLFQTLLASKYRFISAASLVSILFAFWHIVGPVRSYMDGTMSLTAMLVNSLILVLGSGLVGFTFSLMTKLTGSLYMAMASHFTNNFLINILHVQSSQGADEWMFVRVAIAQISAFVFMLVWYLHRNRQTAEAS